MNVWDIVLIVLTAAFLALAVFFAVRNKKRGKSCCGDCCRCAGCAGKKDGKNK